ncbi:2-iminobutanoate/2-iminopropanoate deaminase-like isoform X2 [Daktulosphaira vitifoliae]|uniref:2-iminobutanoate/2-iminopropanoate deaminase-like isoform X2 n=1 Tax=Daktulosphaira vitifoliae TaxID=58002 RepID=UPI0021AAEA24|nr:2-iminobutanoate/2-iminopropanoate deaminase-like isoform X2 [Daktulosphaira vitifoliae]
MTSVINKLLQLLVGSPSINRYCQNIQLPILQSKIPVRFVNMSYLSHISTDLAPKPVGPYSQAVKYGDTVYVSGSLGLDPKSGKMVEGGVGPETIKALENIQRILEASQSSLASVVKTTVLLADIKDGPTVNEIYKQFFVVPYPARAMFQVANLPLGAKVEIEVVAAANK